VEARQLFGLFELSDLPQQQNFFKISYN